jgi:hypothetical protein
MAAIAPALIAASITLLGWFVLDYLTRKRDSETRRHQTRLRYIERQIEEFYGPLHALANQVIVVNHVRHHLLDQLGAGLSADTRGRIDNYLYEEYFRRLHDSIGSLLSQKLYLVDGIRLPESFYDYLRHSVQERVQSDLAGRFSVDTSVVPGVRWPNAFPKDIRDALERKLEEYEASLNRAGQGRPKVA